MQSENQSDILSSTANSVAEGELVDEGMAEAIRRMRARGMAKKAIARELGMNVKTVRKWIATAWTPQQRTRRDEPDLAEHEEWIRNRFPEVGYNATVLHRELREAKEYAGSYNTVQR